VGAPREISPPPLRCSTDEPSAEFVVALAIPPIWHVYLTPMTPDGSPTCEAEGTTLPARERCGGPTAAVGIEISSVTVVEAAVTRVIDGNSLDAHVQGRRTAVGYLGVATPGATEPCGLEALTRNRELVGTRVLLEADPAYDFDAIGRRLYYASTPDGRWIDETLVREGLGYAAHPDAGRGARLAAVQAQAEATATGCLWRGP